jgi:hypothetical protein
VPGCFKSKLRQSSPLQAGVPAQRLQRKVNGFK